MMPAASAYSRTLTSRLAGHADLSMLPLTESTAWPPAHIVPACGHERSVVSLNFGFPARTDSSTIEYGQVRSGQHGREWNGLVYPAATPAASLASACA